MGQGIARRTLRWRRNQDGIEANRGGTEGPREAGFEPSVGMVVHEKAGSGRVRGLLVLRGVREGRVHDEVERER